MNKSALKSFATEARRELLEKVKLQARKLGMTPDAIQQETLESSDAIFIDGKQLSNIERKQRNKLIARINEIGYDRVMEEAAYTWFNRFIALRYMEVNDYLPTKVRVLSSVNPDSTEPDMFKEALNLDLPIDKELVYNLKIENKTDELFKYLIKIHCNDLYRYMPFMFETIEGYTEVLFPEGLLGTDSIVRKMTDVDNIPEVDWTKVEIIGWLYQYYIFDEKDRVIKAKQKYLAEEIPFATQLFTPKWIVRYLVQNSLGKYWVETHENQFDLTNQWEYYLNNHVSNNELYLHLNKELKVEDIKCFDPCMGSGHILVYMFDVLVEIYSKSGYMQREIPRLIIENNLFGLDIDDRAYQLASFSVVMKALEYNKRFLRDIKKNGLKLNLASIQETNHLNEEDIAYFAGESYGEKFEELKVYFKQYENAKTFGSLINIDQENPVFIEQRKYEILSNPSNEIFEEVSRNKIINIIENLQLQTNLLSLKYDIVVTNPPYLSSLYMNPLISDFIQKNYPESKEDLYASFISKCMKFCHTKGHLGILSPYSWMFLSSYEKLRKLIIDNKALSSLVQLEYNAFEAAAVQVAAFTLRNYSTTVPAECINLSNFPGIDVQHIKTLEAVKNEHVSFRYSASMNKFKNISGFPIAYWVSDKVHELFNNSNKIKEFGEAKQGLATGDNNKFLRLWHEVDINDIGFNRKSNEDSLESGKKWFPHSKGGEFRRWYGNNYYVINWENDGYEIKNFKNDKGKQKSRPQNVQYYFKKGITWSDLTAGGFSARYVDNGHIFDTTGPTMFLNDNDNLYYVLGYFNSNAFQTLLDINCSGMHYSNGIIAELPIKIESTIDARSKVESIVKENVALVKNSWDDKEISWNYKKHPLLSYVGITNNIEECIIKYKKDIQDRLFKIKSNEKLLNEYYTRLLGLSEEVVNDNLDKVESIEIVSDEEIVKSFISYIVGCIFGRYSLEKEGIAFAGGNFDYRNYNSKVVKADNIVPIMSNAYLEEDMVSQFMEVIGEIFGEEKEVETIEYISNTLTKKGSETAIERLRRYFKTDFYKDHISFYSTRGRNIPIYWLFTSGKEKAFNCLIYMHRYDKTTLSRIRTDYVHEVQNRMDAERTDLLNIINGDSTVKEIATAKKDLKLLDKKIDELKKYDELLHHMADQQIEINLDDGVKHNYELFKGLVAPIK